MEFLTGGLPALWNVDGLRLWVFNLPVARWAHANQVLLSVFVRVRQGKVRALPERVDVVHRITLDNCRISAAQEREVVWVFVAPASVPLIPLHLAPLFAPDGAGVKLSAAAGTGNDIQHPASGPGIRIKRRRCGGK